MTDSRCNCDPDTDLLVSRPPQFSPTVIGVFAAAFPGSKRQLAPKQFVIKSNIPKSVISEAIVATYDVYALCIACGDLHSMGISVTLEGARIAKQSIAERFRGEELPANIAGLKDARVYCPKFGRHYGQRDAEQIFLVLRD